nr:hypothetical protein BaRGS_027112 [Batillaria attramentaria]
MGNVTSSNVTHADKDATLQALSDERAMQLLPVMILFGIFLLTGVVGNCLTIYIYWTKFKVTWSRTAIVALGVFDLISCCFAIPGEVIDLRFSYNYDYDVLCRLSRLISTFPNMASGIMLTAVAFDRYRLICSPLKASASRKGARRQVLGVCAVTVLFTWPAAVVYGTMTIDTGVDDIKGKECSTSDLVRHTKIPLAYNMLLALVFLTAFTAIVVFYTLIGRQMCKQGEFRKTLISMHDGKRRNTMSSELEPSGASDHDGGRDLSHDDGQSASHRSGSKDEDTLKEAGCLNGGTEANGHVNSNDAPTSPTDSVFSSNPTSPMSPTSPTSTLTFFAGRKLSRAGSVMRSLTLRSKKSADSVINARTRKTTLMLCFISVVFVLSYLPHIVVKLIRTVDKGFLDQPSTGRLVAYNLCARSYFLNCFANVFIYGFCSLRFRKECKKIFGKLLIWRNWTPFVK